MRLRVTALLLIVALCGVIGVQDLYAKAPFVSGFDRFAESQQISSLQAGRLLLTELSCTACHQSSDAFLKPKGGPDLNRVGSRVQSSWIKQFLNSPTQTKPGTTMPDVLSGLDESEKAETIAALTAFLQTLTGEYPEVKAGGASPVPYQFWLKGDPEQGKRLYHKIGCVACHDPDSDYETAERKPTPLDQMIEQLEPDELEELGLSQLLLPVNSVPHGNLTEKYLPKSLTFFLMNPEKDRPAGRMPSFQLEPMEASHIAAYLLFQYPKASGLSPLDANRELVARGREMFVSLGCVNCHSVKGLDPAKFAIALDKLPSMSDRGCWSEQKAGNPYYPVNSEQRSVLATAIEETSETSAETQLDLTLLQLNCLGCHERDQRGGVGRNRKPYLETVRHIDLGDEGRIPPPLTGVGQKLTQAWIKKVLAGEGVIRPHFTARMPKYPSPQIASLPKAFADLDEYQSQSQEDVFGKMTGLAKPGRLLMDTGCVQCHPIRGEALPGVVGVDLGDVTARIHPAWFKKFLFNPGEVKPRTRMPTFFPNGKSSNSTILKGNVDQQIAALWAYLKQGEKLELPEKILVARSQDFELTPKGKPIVLRTFMQDAGTHAIAVGFPEKVHFAYDAEQIRLAEIWKGRFLDAQGTWYERFAPPADPLGKSHHSFAAGPSITIRYSQDPEQVARITFRGYRLDPSGIPVFLQTIGNWEIEEQLIALKDGSLKRNWRLESAAETQEDQFVELNVVPEGKFQRPQPNTIEESSGLKILLSGVKESDPTATGWRVPLTKSLKNIEVQYQW